MIPTKEQVQARFEKEMTDYFHFPLWQEFRGKILAPYLPFQFLKDHYFKDDIEDKAIKEFMQPLEKDRILKEALDYLSFAWEKCNDERGISANRSIEHYIEWFWLAGEEDFSNKIYVEYDTNYHSYGSEILKMIEAKLKELLK